MIDQIKTKLGKISPVQVLVVYLTVMAVFATNSWGGDIMFWGGQILRLCLIYLGMRLAYLIMSSLFVVRDTGRWENRVITSLILYLLFDPLIGLSVFFALGVITEVIQRVFRSLTGPVINPAAAGVLSMIIFGYLPGWWGMSFAPRIYIVPDGVSLSVFLTLIMAGFVAYKYKKIYIAVVFGLLYFMLATFLKGSDFSVFAISEGTVMFFMLVMLIEPKTSPAIERDQLIYSVVVGLAVILLIEFLFADPYSGGLAVGNLCSFLIMWYMKRNRLVLPTLKHYGPIEKQ